MGIYDRFEIGRITGELEATGEAAASEPSDLDAFGREHDVFVRVLDAEGNVVRAGAARFGDGRISRRWWWARAADLWFGPEGPPDPEAFEASQRPVPERTEVEEAIKIGRATTVVRGAPGGNMFVLYRVVPTASGRYVYLARVSRRSARALYDLRFQLMKLTIALAFGGLLMGGWLAWGVVGPLRGLQRRVRRAIATGEWTEKKLTRRDEIGQLSRDFDRLAGRLMTRLEDSANVAADFAHDLKNPIAAVQASAELLEADQPLDAERRARIARSVTSAASHMRRSVDAMLELARLDEGLEKEPRQVVELTVAIERVATGFADDVRHESTALELELDEDVTLYGNGPRLEELVRNLVDNAALFAASKIRVELRGTDDAVLITVADDGPGVSEGNRDKIFARFFSARPDGAEPGSGLGLAIVESIARAHRGSVVLSPDRPLGGAAFVVELPRVTPA